MLNRYGFSEKNYSREWRLKIKRIYGVFVVERRWRIHKSIPIHWVVFSFVKKRL